MLQWVNITSSIYWEPKVLVDSGVIITWPVGAPPDNTRGAEYCVWQGIDDTPIGPMSYVVSAGTPYMNNGLGGGEFGYPDLHGAYLDMVAPGLYPAFAYSGSHWVPSAQTHTGLVVPILNYIGPAFSMRSDVRVTLTCPAAGSGFSSIFCVGGKWSDLLAVPYGDYSGAGGLDLNFTIPFNPPLDPAAGGSSVSTLGIGAQNGTIIQLLATHNSADILSTLAFGTIDISNNLVAVPTITMIEVYADFNPLFWQDFLNTTEQDS